MSVPSIDEAILSVVGRRRMKVAMLIAKVTRQMGGDLPQGDEGCQAVATRIEALVGDGRLVALGNLQNWRFSEVRQPN
jgi:hypothetical protein